MKKVKKFLCLPLALLLLPAMLAGCGKREDPFQVLFAAPFVSQEQVASFGGRLFQEGQTQVKYSGFSIGSEDVDPMSYSAGAMMLSAMMAAGEVDVMVCDLGEAARYARSGAFLDLTEVFTPEELAPYGDRLVDFDMMDMNAEPTGEKTPLCGLDMSGHERLNFVMGSESYAVFIVASTGDLDTAREAFWKIVNS